MALHQDRPATRARSRDDLLRALVFAVLVIGLMAVATIVFGIQGAGPSLELVPDPAGAMPF
jgi:hypothetical protein